MKLHKVWTRDYDAYLCYGASRGLYNNKTLRYPVQQAFIFPNGKNKELYLVEEEYQKLWTALHQYYIVNINHFFSYVDEIIAEGKRFVTASKAASKDVKKLSSKQLLQRYRAFQQEYVRYFGYLWSSFILNEIISEEVGNVINNLTLDKEEKRELIAYATKPAKRASIMLLNHQAKHKTPPQLVKLFAWITTLNISDQPASLVDIMQRLTGHDNQSTRPKSLSELDSHTCILIRASRDNAYIKDRRDDYRRMGTYYVIPLYEEIAHRLNRTRADLAYFVPDEIERSLRGSAVPRERITLRREQGFLMWWHDNDLTFEDSLSSIAALKRRFISPSVESKVHEFKGVPGCKGRIQGRVKIVTTVKELNKVQPNDILVAVTTNPDYLPAMQKAAAFITDEGGLTCHAAIVAREMKKPCIVGTKIATSVLHDGDEIDVNANHGVIKVLHVKA